MHSALEALRGCEAFHYTNHLLLFSELVWAVLRFERRRLVTLAICLAVACLINSFKRSDFWALCRELSDRRLDVSGHTAFLVPLCFFAYTDDRMPKSAVLCALFTGFIYCIWMCLRNYHTPADIAFTTAVALPSLFTLTATVHAYCPGIAP